MEPERTLLDCIFYSLKVALRGAEPAYAKVYEGKVPLGVRTREFKVEGIHLRFAREREFESSPIFGAQS